MLMLYKDKNNKLLGLQEGKLDDAKARTNVIAINDNLPQVNLDYNSTTSNYALRYKSKFTNSGIYTIKVNLDNSYELNHENSDQLTVIDNIYNLPSS